MRVKELTAFITERERIRVKKLAGKPKPWTTDPILQKYRFCNVHREDDTVTKWIAGNWREPHAHSVDLFFGMCVARIINWPVTMEALGWPAPWNPKRFINTIREMRARGQVAYGPAYVVSTNGRKMEKSVYLAEQVLTPIWQARNTTRPTKRGMDTLQGFYERLRKFQGLGSFMAAQVVADMKYAEPLTSARDWNTFAASGPGSRRGLNRVCGSAPGQPWGGEFSWYSALINLRTGVNKMLAPMVPLHAQDLQNCLCEFDKYERVRLGEGTPKRLYDGV